MPSPSSTIPRPPIAPSSASCSRCGIATAARRVRSIPRRPPDLTFFAAVLSGEHALQGVRNRDQRVRLFGPPAATDRQRSAHVSRLLKRLHLRGLLAKIPRSRRWRVTQRGHAVMSIAVLVREDHFPRAFLPDAA